MALANVKNVVLVLSGKGGVGKSSVTTQLALSLTLQGHNVGILDVDLTGPSIPRLLGIEDAKVKQIPGGWTPVPVHGAQELSSSTKIGSLNAMSLAFLLASRSTAIVWRGPKKTAMIRQFLSTTVWPAGTDYLLVDTPPGTSDEHISLVETLLKEITGATDGANGSTVRTVPTLAGAVIVTTPQAVAVSDVRKELNFCSKTGVKVIGVVENMSGYVCPCCGEAANLFSKGGGEVMATEFKVPFLGSVPVDPLWGVLVEEGKRPKYDQEVADKLASDAVDDADDEEGVNSENGETQDATSRTREEGLLVDKYQDCSLASNFKAIAEKVVLCAENGNAVSVGQV